MRSRRVRKVFCSHKGAKARSGFAICRVAAFIIRELDAPAQIWTPLSRQAIHLRAFASLRERITSSSLLRLRAFV